MNRGYLFVPPGAPSDHPVFSGVVTVPAGSAGAPGIAFAGDTATGFHQPGPGAVGVAAAGGFTVNGATVWHAANDGAGSGCDADLLDGREGSWYQPAAAPLGALAALDATAGLVEQTGALAFAKRALGAGAATSVPTLGDADARYAKLAGASFTGAVLAPAQPAFCATLTAQQSNVTGDGTVYTIVCDTRIFDQAANYNAATGLFTAPATGRYRFDCSVCLIVGATHTRAEFMLVTSNRTHFLSQINAAAMRDASGNATIISGMRLADLHAGDTACLQIKVSNGTKTASVFGTGTGAVYTSFMGTLEC